MTTKVVGIYVDRQAKLQYPVGLISEPYEDFDRIYWFTSDYDNLLLLQKIRRDHPLSGKIKIVSLGISIREPRDIGTAQTASVKYMQKLGVDIVGYQQADLYLTPGGAEAVNRELRKATPTTAFSVAAMQNKLYCESYPTPHCCFFIGSEIEHKWPWGWENYWRLPEGEWQQFVPLEQADAVRLMIDLGYLDTGAFYRKMVNHQDLWTNQPWILKMQRLLETDVPAAVLYGLQRLWAEMRYLPEHKPHVVEYSGVYRQVIDRLGFYDDYCMVKEVVEAL